MKFAFFILAFFLLLQTYHARHLHDVFVNRRFNRPAPLRAAKIIKMVTRGEKLLYPPLLQDKTTYGRENSSPPPPEDGSTRIQTSQITQTSSNPCDLDLHDVFVNRRFNQPAPLLATKIIQMVTRGEELLSPPLLQDKTTYGRENSSPPQDGSTQGQTTYGRINPKAPPSPSVAPSRGQTTFGVQNPNFASQITQTSSNPSDLDLHGIYGRDDPSVPTPPKPADPIHPVLSEYARTDSKSESTDLSTSVVNLLASYAIRVSNLWG